PLEPARRILPRKERDGTCGDCGGEVTARSDRGKLMERIVSLLAGGSLAMAVVALVSAFAEGAWPDAAALRATDPPPGAIWLESLDLGKIVQGFGHPHAGRSVDGNPLTLRDVVYPHGIGTHSRGRMEIDLKEAATR